MDGSRRLALLLGLSLLTGMTGCHGRFLIPPPPGYAYGAHPAASGGYGPYGDCVNGGGGYSSYGADYGYGGHGALGQRAHHLRENLQARRQDRSANRHHRHPGHRRGHKPGRRAGHGEIGCDGAGTYGLDGACDSCDSCDGCGDCEIDCGETCTSCSSCGCGGMMMGGTNPGPYVAYLIPMESYQGELGGDGMCFNGMSGCDTCGPGIINGEVIDNGFINGSGGPCEYTNGGTCAGGSCETYSGDDQNWQTVPGQLLSPDASPAGSKPQIIRPPSQETLPVPPQNIDEGDFERPTPDDEKQAGYLVPQNTLWVPNQL